jgi:beta propeller repeat protein
MTGAGDQHSPAIVGNQLAWVEDGPAPVERAFIVHDMASETTFVVATGAAQRTFRAAITGGTPRVVDAIPGEHRAQRIDGARVAVEADGCIWVYDMNFGTATQLTANGSDGTDASPVIDGARVAWETDRNGNRDIYVASVDGWTIGVPATVLPTVAPTTTASRFGGRRYVVGGGPQRPSAGAAVGSSVFGSARPRALVGSGTETGTSPPATRFVRWSPIARWRTGGR